MQYNVVADDDIPSLVKKVNQAIQAGWKPQGGIAVAALPSGEGRFLQAMIK